MPGDALQEPGHLRDLRRRLAAMTIEQKAQDELEVIELYDVGSAAKRLGINALQDQRGSRQPQLGSSCLQRGWPGRTSWTVLAQVGAGEANEESVDVRLE